MVVPYESGNTLPEPLQAETEPTILQRPAPSAGITPIAPKRNNTVPSCAVCQRRKVKCDRVYPCAPCQKTGLVCEYKTTHNHGRKRRRVEGPPDGTTPQQHDGDGSISAQPTTAGADETTRVVDSDGGVRYVGNHLWTAITTPSSQGATSASTSSRRAPQASPARMQAGTPSQGISGNSIYESAVSLGSELVAQSSNETTPHADPGHNGPGSFVFDAVPSNHFQSTQHTPQPRAHHVVQLWQTYLSNVDPMMKVFHAPTLQQVVLGQIGKPTLPAGFQALTSAIYFISAVSLQDDESKALLSLPRDELLEAYRSATEEALSNAGFLTTSDLQVMQAFVLYLAAMRSLGHIDTVWSMTGLAIRVAGTMGLGRDGSLLGLQPFECEVRRRVWWALTYLDARTAELMDQDGDLLVHNHDVRLPANLNDSQLFPTMQRLPESKPAATEASYILLRAMCATTLNNGSPGLIGTWKTMRATNVSSTEKEKILEDFEQKIEEEILRFCDTTVPLQAFTINAAQTLIVKMRLVGNVPYGRSPNMSRTVDATAQNLFNLSMKMMQLQLELFTSPTLQRWRWHWQGHFQWYAFAELIRQTRRRQPGLGTTKAWNMIHKVVDIIMPALDLPARKCPLLDSMRMLFQSALAAGVERQQRELAGEVLVGEQAKTASMAAGRSAAARGGQMGSRPFAALLPGMSGAMDRGSQDVDDTPASLEDPLMELNFDSIDWNEFDRLATGLCGD